MVTYIKGGVWTNVEDEILRAAVAKYGLNQWARVSSLLVRKTAKQVKARWTEWLDPAIRKVEWSREEDEKLLHLAKLMPTQWRSIAPLVGRTANQCIERYQKLLDDAERREQKDDLSLSGVGSEASAASISSGSRTHRLGDIDPNPETRPARPDAVDMDEDEKEMLSEARARLANTKGKKAKRKDRERLLEESRRLALLQKRRELKQAGINTKLRPKMKGSINYNADIPFEHKPAPGFYDTSEEKEANDMAKAKYDSFLEKKGYRSGKKEGGAKGNKRDRSDNNKVSAAEAAATARAEKLMEINESEQIAKRRKLVLPEPQVRDDELDQIIKHAKRADESRQSNDNDTSTSTLLGEYGEIINEDSYEQPIQTTSLANDRINRAMADIKSLNETQSSLLGQENTPLNNESIQVSKMLPPPMVSSHRNTVFRTVDQTPRRDALGVNSVGSEATPISQIRSGFASLPKPKNDFEIAMPEEMVEPVANDLLGSKSLVEDKGEKERLIIAQRELEHQKELDRRSQVLKRGLPRPLVDLNTKFIDNDLAPSQKLILVEMVQLIKSDSVKWPLENGDRMKEKINVDIHNGSNKYTEDVGIPDLTDDEKSRAVALISEEGEHTHTNALPLTQSQAVDAKVSFSTIDSRSMLSSLTNYAQRSKKSEQKLGLILGGYMKRQSILLDKLNQSWNALEELQTKRLVFQQLKDMEDIALSSRLSRLQEEVNFVVDAERAGQEKYKALKESINLATLA